MPVILPARELPRTWSGALGLATRTKSPPLVLTRAVERLPPAMTRRRPTSFGAIAGRIAAHATVLGWLGGTAGTRDRPLVRALLPRHGLTRLVGEVPMGVGGGKASQPSRRSPAALARPAWKLGGQGAVKRS